MFAVFWAAARRSSQRAPQPGVFRSGAGGRSVELIVTLRHGRSESMSAPAGHPAMSSASRSAPPALRTARTPHRPRFAPPMPGAANSTPAVSDGEKQGPMARKEVTRIKVPLGAKVQIGA
jgi:hypothetical protein